MMNPRRTFPAAQTGSAKLWPKTLGLFAISLALFFTLFVGYDVLTSVVESSAAQTVATQQQVIVIDPQIADELSKVLATDQSQNLVDVSDPFNDRAGLSGGITAVAATTTTGGSSSGSGGQSTTIAGTTGGASSVGNSAVIAAVPSAIEATRDRYNEWLARITAYGDMPLDPRVFAIEDLLPVGIVDGGNGNQEVLFYSEAAGRTVSFMVGTSFFDGRLTELRPEGVVFSSFDGRQPIRMRSWARSLKTTD